MKKTCLFNVIGIILLQVITAQAQDLDQNIQSGLRSIKPMDPYHYVKTMCKPAFAGRFTGHKGYTKAANWAASKFQEWGLKPVGTDYGYLQPFPAPYTMIKESEMTLLLPDGEETKHVGLELEKDYLPLLYADSGDTTAGLAFVGWGVSAPELGYDDYAGVNVEGKFVVCFRGVPDRDVEAFRKHDQHRHRMSVAKQKGALGLFYIYSEPIANPNGDWIDDFMPAKISENVADKLFEEKGIQVSELKRDLRKYKKPLSFPLKSKVRYRIESEYHPNGTGYNVIGMVEGSDPTLKNECIVIGGHFDHCGKHIGLLFAGANDNASGSAVVMEVAEAFSKVESSPKRSVVFVLFGGEEMGLKGSNYFVEHVPKRFEKVDAMFNFDMVAEGDGVNCGYSEKPPEFYQLIKEADAHVNILKRARALSGSGGGSDYAPFHQEGITAATFHSNGPHIDYHQTGDSVYRINPEIMADIAKLAFLSAYQWADR